MMSKASPFNRFQDRIWNSLPIRKKAVGREIIDDVIAIAIQMWPSDGLAQADKGSVEEDMLLAVLLTDIRRIMCLLYGKQEWHAYVLVGLSSLNPHILAMILDWWRRRKLNRTKLKTWQEKWTSDDE
jgi:hypothetical protein